MENTESSNIDQQQLVAYGYIYEIYNDINNKVYIGKTCNTVEKRWQQHKWNRTKRTTEKRPLYSAMNKYGIEYFHARELERCSIEQLSEREIYWIDRRDSYQNGYNATLGGDGKTFYDYNEIYNLYQKFGTAQDVAKELNCDLSTVRKALKCFNINANEMQHEREKELHGKKCFGVNIKTGVKIGPFNSRRDAAQFIINSHLTKQTSSEKVAINISRVCRDTEGNTLTNRKTAFGYIWYDL